jgi:hypothetical protein
VRLGLVAATRTGFWDGERRERGGSIGSIDRSSALLSPTHINYSTTNVRTIVKEAAYHTQPREVGQPALAFASRVVVPRRACVLFSLSLSLGRAPHAHTCIRVARVRAADIVMLARPRSPSSARARTDGRRAFKFLCRPAALLANAPDRRRPSQRALTRPASALWRDAGAREKERVPAPPTSSSVTHPPRLTLSRAPLVLRKHASANDDRTHPPSPLAKHARTDPSTHILQEPA